MGTPPRAKRAPAAAKVKPVVQDAPPATAPEGVAAPEASTPIAILPVEAAEPATIAPPLGEPRRAFPVLHDVWLDGVLLSPTVKAVARVTRTQFDQLKAGSAVAGQWDDGDTSTS